MLIGEALVIVTVLSIKTLVEMSTNNITNQLKRIDAN